MKPRPGFSGPEVHLVLGRIKYVGRCPTLVDFALSGLSGRHDLCPGPTALYQGTGANVRQTGCCPGSESCPLTDMPCLPAQQGLNVNLFHNFYVLVNPTNESSPREDKSLSGSEAEKKSPVRSGHQGNAALSVRDLETASRSFDMEPPIRPNEQPHPMPRLSAIDVKSSWNRHFSLSSLSDVAYAREPCTLCSPRIGLRCGTRVDKSIRRALFHRKSS